jgi:hypothetical protein
MHKKCVTGAGKMKMRILLFSLLCLLCLTINLYAQDEEYLNIVILEEPSWVYKARGDRFYREGKYGNALAQYKKALIRRKQGGSNQKIDGIDIEMGLSRQGGNLDIYLRKLDRFRTEHEETSDHVERALRENRYDEARSLIQILQHDAFDIGAEMLKADAEALDRSIYVRKYAEWDYLQERLFESDIGEKQGSLTIVLTSLNEQYIDNIGSSDPKLRLQIEGNAPYPEVHLKIAQIYLEEGLFDLSLQQLDMAEKGQEHFQIPDLIFSVMYTRAENYRTRAEFYKEHGNKKGFNREADKYGRELNRIVEKDENWRGGKEGTSFKGYKDIKLNEIPNSRILHLSGDAEGREKYGKAYFLSGAYKFQNGRDEGAEPYLKMAFLYGYERETAKRYLEQYYILRNDTANLKKIEDIEALFR